MVNKLTDKHHLAPGWHVVQSESSIAVFVRRQPLRGYCQCRGAHCSVGMEHILPTFI